MNKIVSAPGVYPPTRFMGSKEMLLGPLWDVIGGLGGDTVVDLFSGSGVVSHMLKAKGRRVLSNDHMAMAHAFTLAMVENDDAVLTEADVNFLLSPADDGDGFVAATFDGLYFSRDDNNLIDSIRANLKRLGDPLKGALGMAALVRACIKKRPRGIFTYTGARYDDGRRDLRLSLADQFRLQVAAVNAAVFAGQHPCEAHWGDALNSPLRGDLVYMDPPYFSPLSDNEYVRRYHFVEGLARDWRGVEIQTGTKTRKFKGYPTPFRTARGAHEAFEALFRRHADSTLVVSYASNALPDRASLVGLMKRFKRRVEVIEVAHRYSFGTQSRKNRNKVSEFIFVGT